MKKFSTAIIIFAYIVVSAILPVVTAVAGAVTDTISIYIGYFGWEEDQYIEKATFHWRELDGMFGGVLGSHEVVYSYFSGSRTYHAAARGFYIRDLLEYAGIDFGSISRIDFFTRDQTIGPYRSFTKSSLFDMSRYYFPYLAVDEETGEIYPYHGGDFFDGATRVEAMLALEDYTVWDNIGYMLEETYDSAMFSTASRFHLFFGQLSPSEANTSSAAKYVYKLFITFTGTPVLSTEQTNIELKVGNNFRMIVNVSAEDTLLDSYVAENLIWSSSDDSIVSVDSFGNLTLTAEGEAVITASFGEASVSAVVRVGADDVVTVSPESESGGGSGNGGGSGSDGGGSSGGGGSAVGDESGAEAEGGTVSAGNTEIAEDASEEQADTPVEIANPVIPLRENAEVVFLDNVSAVYLLSPELMDSDEYAAWARRVLGRNANDNGGEGALSGSREGGMGSDAIQLILPLQVKPSFLWVIALAFLAFFILGFAYEVFSFKKRL